MKEVKNNKVFQFYSIKTKYVFLSSYTLSLTFFVTGNRRLLKY